MKNTCRKAIRMQRDYCLWSACWLYSRMFSRTNVGILDGVMTIVSCRNQRNGILHCWKSIWMQITVPSDALPFDLVVKWIDTKKCRIWWLFQFLYFSTWDSCGRWCNGPAKATNSLNTGTYMSEPMMATQTIRNGEYHDMSY